MAPVVRVTPTGRSGQIHGSVPFRSGVASSAPRSSLPGDVLDGETGEVVFVLEMLGQDTLANEQLATEGARELMFVAFGGHAPTDSYARLGCSGSNLIFDIVPVASRFGRTPASGFRPGNARARTPTGGGVRPGRG